MKKLVLIAVLLGSVCVAIAQNTVTQSKDILTANVERDFYTQKQLELYKILPTTLSLWSHSDWSSIGFNGSYREGNFKTIDDFKKSREFSFKTESVQSFKKNGLTFYGNFTFRSAKYEEASWNLFHTKSTNGSPFRTVILRTGDWDTKHYGISGMMSKKIGDKTYLGAAVDYEGDLYFRMLDTRNDQTNLTMNYTGSITYNIKTTHFLSLGVTYHRKRSEPKYHNEYNAASDEYLVFTTKGLGDFDSQQNTYSLNIKDQNPEFTLSYHGGEKNKLSINYSFYPGSEQWRYYITSLGSTTPEELYKYDYTKQNLTSSYLINTPQLHLLSKIKAQLISGEGFEYRNGYQSTYIYDDITVNSSFDLLRDDRRLFDQINLEVAMENISKKDMQVAQLMEYANIMVGTSTGFNYALNSSNNIRVTLGGKLKYNLSYTHDLGAASSKAYTKNIAYNEMAYATADYVSYGTEISWYTQYNKMSTQWSLKMDHTAPTNIRINNQYSVLEESTNKNSIGLNFKLFF